MNQKKYHSGQVALIALLVLTIATTLGLSLISRTTTDISATRNIEDSTRAFSAAEAGIEETLKSGIAGSGDIDTSLGISYDVKVDPMVGSTSNPFVFSQKTLSENTETVWLVAHSDPETIIETPTYTTDTIDVCWSSESPTPALVVSVLYKKSGGSYQVAKVAYDPDGSRANNFSSPTALSGGCGANTNTTYRSTIRFPDLSINPVNDTLIALRIRPVYSGTLIAIKPAQGLPIQGDLIQSTGKAGSDVTRKIIVYRQYEAPASIFDYAVYSEGSGGSGGDFKQ
jgi:Tfp pilus assembly protein PilX